MEEYSRSCCRRLCLGMTTRIECQINTNMNGHCQKNPCRYRENWSLVRMIPLQRHGLKLPPEEGLDEAHN